MNIIQKLVALLGLLVASVQILVPPWEVKWTVTFDYDYSYESASGARAPAAESAPAPRGHGQESSSYVAVRRGLLYFGPFKPRPALPPPEREHIGTGTVDFGRRIKVYTKVAVTDFKTRIITTDLLWQTLASVGSTIVMVAMLGSPSGFSSWRLPLDSFRHKPFRKTPAPFENAPRQPVDSKRAKTLRDSLPPKPPARRRPGDAQHDDGGPP